MYTYVNIVYFCNALCNAHICVQLYTASLLIYLIISIRTMSGKIGEFACFKPFYGFYFPSHSTE